MVPQEDAVTELHRAAERGDVAPILAFGGRPEFIDTQTMGEQALIWWRVDTIIDGVAGGSRGSGGRSAEGGSFARDAAAV
jgi:hypothetical protein